MKRILGAVAIAIVILSLSAPPAYAETETVNAAENATRWGSRGSACDVLVDDFAEMEVNLYCFSQGRGWIKVRVPDVTGSVTRVSAAGRGDCSGKDLSFRKSGDVVTVKILHVGDDFDCYYRAVRVRHTG